MGKRPSILFLTLNVFAETGGIEKVCRVAGRAFNEIAVSEALNFNIYSLHDGEGNFENKYFPKERIRGFKSNIPKFILAGILLKRGERHTVVMSHINVLIVGWLIKMLFPKTRLLLIAHGIEIWSKQSFSKRVMLKSCDKILAVSNYTAERMISVNHISAKKVMVLHNCLDPFLKQNGSGFSVTRASYGLMDSDIVMLAVTRYSSKEKYKGYDKVLTAMKDLVPVYPNLKYLLVGKYDELEKERIDGLVNNYGLERNIKFAGFVTEVQLADIFTFSDFFIMPSEKEGFGIVFIEAMFYDLPVIAGNRDGSVDALLNGKLGLLIDPENNKELQNALIEYINHFNNHRPDRDLLFANFGYDTYLKRWRKLILDL